MTDPIAPEGDPGPLPLTDDGRNPMWDWWRAQRAEAGIEVPHRDSPTRGSCQDCQWQYYGGPGSWKSRCRRFGGHQVDRSFPACPSYDERHTVDCLECGACCRQAFDVVEIRDGDPFLNTEHAHAVVLDAEGKRALPRPDKHCVFLGREHEDDDDTPTCYRCTIYEDRPTACRDFELGSMNCLTARVRTGVTA